MKRELIRSNNGFTLIEMIIAMGITVFSMGMIGLVYSNTAKQYMNTKKVYQTQMRSRLAIDYIAQEMKNGGYVLNWDTVYWGTNPNDPPIGINDAVSVPTRDANTDSITVRYGLGPLTAQLNGNHVIGVNTLTVDALPFAIPLNSKIVVYGPPTTVNFRQVTAPNSIGDVSITLNAGTPTSVAFRDDDFIALVQETSFWIQGGDLMTNSGGGNQRIASNVEDLQVALITKDDGIIGDGDNTNNGADSAGTALSDDPSSLTVNQMLEVRAIRISLTGRSEKQVVDGVLRVPPSLENHDRSGEAGDRVLRRVQQTTVYLRNFGAFD